MKSLRNRLLIRFVLVALLPLAVVAVAARMIASRQMHETVAERLDGSLRGVEIEIQGIREDLAVRTAAVADEPAFVAALKADDRATLLRFLNRSLLVLDVDEITAIDASGKVVARGLAATRYGDDASSRQSIKQALQGDLVIGVRRGEFGIGVEVVLPVRDGAQILGVLQVEDSLDHRFLSRLKQKFGLDAMIFDADRLQASTFSDPEIIHTIDADLRQQMAQAETAHGIEDVAVAGEQYFFGVVSLLGKSQESPALLVMGISQQRVHATIASLTWRFSLVALAVLLVSVVLCFRITSRIVRPIETLSQMVVEVAQGDLSRRVSAPCDDEIGQLAVAFNRLTSELQETTTSIEHLNREISERQQAEDELCQREHDFRLLAENVPGLFAYIDVEGRYRFVNKRYEEWFGVRSQQVVGKHLREVVGEAFYEKIRPRVERVLAGENITYEDRLPFRDAGPRWVVVTYLPYEVQGVVDGFFVLVIDVHTRKQAEEKRQAAELRYRTLFEQSPDAVVLIDPETLLPIEFNDPAPRLLGYSREQFAQLSVADYEAEEDLNEIRAHRERVLCDGRDEFETRWRTKDGQLRDVLVSIRVITIDGRTVFHNIIRDITEQKRAQERMRQQEMELAHVARLSTMGEMGTGLAHELNQPLGAIANYCFALQQACRNGDALDREQMSEMIERVSEQSLRAGEIVRRLRAFVQKTGPRRESSDLNKVVREVVALAERDLKLNQIQLDLELDEAIPAVLIDAIQIQQVVLNLVRNANEAMQDMPSERRCLSITSSVNGRRVEVAVNDLGHGIDQQNLDKVFNAFYSTKETGMGMGLAISRSIIEHHHGRLWADPNDGHGMTFRFSIPLEDVYVGAENT